MPLMLTPEIESDPARLVNFWRMVLLEERRIAEASTEVDEWRDADREGLAMLERIAAHL